jgi:hypothetical protein
MNKDSWIQYFPFAEPRKEQEEAQKAVLSIENLRAAMFQAERSGDTKRQKELETAFKYSSR